MSTGLAVPAHAAYDIVIVGGGIMAATTAWHLVSDPDFDGRVLVVERDPTYETASTTHTNSCIRQQFSTELNIRISQFGAAFIKDLRGHLGGDDRVPELSIRSFGYLYLAADEAFADTLRRNREVQAANGAATALLSPEDILRDYPYYNVDDIGLGSINRVDEGYFDGGAIFDWCRRLSRERGVEWVHNEVVGFGMAPGGARVDHVKLSTGEEVACGQVVNASGPRAAKTAAMAEIALPVEPRKRYTWIFKAEQPVKGDLPLTIDPSGVHFRENGGGSYMAGGHGDPDPAAAFDDFTMDFDLWENHVWPAIATRVPQFEAIRVLREWTGHYAYNTLDQNAVVGPHPEVTNFHFLNGFSGHGLQQSPAMGRAMAEMLIHGSYRSLDFTPFGFERIAADRPFVERAVI